MRKLLCRNISVVMGLLATSCAPMPAAQTQNMPVSAQNFETTGYEIFQSLRASAGPEDNTFISPLSVRQAVGLAHAGARGATASEIEHTLGISAGTAGDAELGAERQTLLADTGAVTVKLANALWLNNKYAFRPDYLGVTQQTYAARVDRLDFVGDSDGSAKMINNWAADATNGLIRGIVAPFTLKPGPTALLTNALFFEGRWQVEFFPAVPDKFLFGDGREKPFPLMGTQATFAYAEAGGWKAVRLPYRASADGQTAPRFVMDVFVPIRRQVGAALPSALYTKLTGMLGGTKAQLVQVTLPRFEIEWKDGLVPAMMTAGIRTAFDPDKADFGPMLLGNGVFSMDDVVQASKLQVFETGTRAAAVTAIEIIITGMRRDPTKPKIFRADQPFHVVIRDVKYGTVLFVGRIATPAIYKGTQLL